MRYSIVAVSVLDALSQTAALAEEPADEVRATYQEYRAALLKGDGEATWKIVDAATQAYYGKLVKQAINLPEKQLDQLDTISMLMVVRLRHEFPKAKLKEMTGKKMLLHAVAKGMIDKSAVKRLDKLGKIEVNGPAAKAYHPLLTDTPMFYFAKDADGWRLARRPWQQGR